MNIVTFTLRIQCAALLAAFVLAGSAPAQEIHEAPADRVPLPAEAAPVAGAGPRGLHRSDAFDPARHIRSLGRLRAEEVAAAERSAAARFAHVTPAPVRVGLVRNLPRPATLAEPEALRVREPDGRDSWLLALESPQAHGVRLHINNFSVGGGTVWVYADTPDGPLVRGPYTGRGPNGDGDFWTPFLPGERVVIEVTGAAEPQLEVAEVTHFNRNPGAMAGNAVQAANCFEDVMCFSVDPLVRDAVGQMNFMSGGGSFVCSGTILNDLDGDTFVPYFLTAFHCLNTQAEVNSLEVVFLWQRASCGGALPNYSTLPRLTGGTLVAANSGNDMTFIRLAGALPGGVSLAGWTTADPTGNGYGIHHPGGDWKRVHLMYPNSSFNACNGLPHSQFHYFQLTRGNYAGGSSGSAAFDSNSRVVGQLFGICPDGAGQCDNYPDWRAVYGKFGITYPLIRLWLEIGGTIHVDRNYVGAEEGTPSRPYNTVNEGKTVAWNGARLKIRTGNYGEGVHFNRPLTVVTDGGAVTIGRP
jgi:hypothetical protein